ncbi:MAG: glycogen synthase GlgA [Pseudomonadota bacterium]
MRHVLSVTSECVPLVKTGGLADVAGALPGALMAEGWEMRTVLPGYPVVMDALGKTKSVLTFDTLFGGPAKVLQARATGLKLYVLDAPHLFKRDGGPYNDAAGRDWPDNPQRFAALCLAGARIAAEGAGAWTPEVVHAHDWQAGLTPYYLHRDGTGVASVMTIHNIAFHGLAPAALMDQLGLDRADYTEAGFEYWDGISALKAGLNFATKLTTVSPSYARELMTPEFGMGLDGVLRQRADDLSGILNGIDTEVWNPASDPNVPAYKSPPGKRRAKAALRKAFGLGEADGPLCVVVSRLSDQKGLDLLLDALPALVDRGGQLALLGSGDPTLEGRFRAADHGHPSVAVRIGYDEALSHLMIAGADAIVVPSRFEPCGLTQLYGLRYGTVPIVAYTGGLIDTVIDATPMALRTGVATGFHVHPATSDALARALMRATDFYKQGDIWRMLQRNGMKMPVGWERSAADYAALYDEIAPPP